jgi:hypothetical protein
METAAERGDNPVFNGRLLDWQGVGLFEHITIDPDWDDKLSDPLAPRAKLGVDVGVDGSAGDRKLVVNASNQRCRYFEWFPGYKYEWWEGQALDASWTSFYAALTHVDKEYYAWIINENGSVGFVSYGGGGNDGNVITLKNILSPDGAGGSGKGALIVGDMNCTGDTWDSTPGVGGAVTANTSADFRYTDTFQAGAYIIPCNAKGAPDMQSLMFAQHAAVRAYVGDDKFISQERDFGFVNGFGYETIFGQAPCERTDGITNGYMLIEHTGQHQGLEVPTLAE